MSRKGPMKRMVCRHCGKNVAQCRTVYDKPKARAHRCPHKRSCPPFFAVLGIKCPECENAKKKEAAEASEAIARLESAL